MHWDYVDDEGLILIRFTHPQLILALGPTSTLSAECPCEISTGGQIIRTQAGTEPSRATQDTLDALTKSPAASVTIDKKGTLELRSQSNDWLRLTGGGPWESWSFNAPDGSKVVCLADAELAVWGPAKPVGDS